MTAVVLLTLATPSLATPEDPTILVQGSAFLEAPVMLWTVQGGEKDIDFQLTAGRADWGYYDHAGANVTGTGAFSPHSPRIPLPGKVQDLSVVAHSWMDGAAFVIKPLGTAPPPVVRFNATGLSLAPESETCRADPLPFKTLTEACHHVAGTGAVSTATIPPSIQVTGTFKLRLWGMEGKGSDSNGTWGFRSGPDGPLAGPVQVIENNLDDVSVYNGTLVLALRTATLGGLDVRNATILSATAVKVSNPWGKSNLAGPVQARVDFAQAPPAVSWQAVGPADPAPAPPPLAPQAADWDWVMPASVVGIVVAGGVGVVLYFLLRPRNPVLRALHAGKPARAARLAAMAAPAQSAEESAVRAVAFIQAGELALAEKQLVAYALPPADHLFVMATLRARQGRADEARSLLRQCIALDPAYASEARFNADLTGLGPGGPGEPPQPREGYS